ncbi:MAG: VTT domain-containing protein, partial [Candidatus Aenigmarchaeota archaeon]|nr:VTT domain-containing protein [Candidatus Aenigmarchaeota archaeon]
MDIASLLAQFTAWGGALVKDWGYLGIFAISLLSSASIILPLPSFALVFAAGAMLNPLLVGLAAGFGCAIGELTGYAVGFGGKQALNRKYRKLLERTEKWVEKHGFFAVVVLFAATPLPDDITGIIAGALNYNIKKFFIASLTGKLALNLALAFGGFYGYAWC